MNEKKIRMEFFAFYDYSGIQAKLENMAAKGWMLEKIGTYFWHYRHIEPQKLHFAVTYLPKLSRFDPENSREQLEMEEYCKRDGWKLAARNAQMQIFITKRNILYPLRRMQSHRLTPFIVRCVAMYFCLM